jgi:D-xylonolactonase
MARSIDRIADTVCTIGEGPFWHSDEGVLYWCDIPEGVLYRYSADEGYEQVHDGELIGGFTAQGDGSLLLFQEGGRIRSWRNGQTEIVLDGIPAERDGRFNDVIADPRGRVFAGTVITDDHLGRLYRIDRDGSYHRVVEGLDLPNGLGFSPGLKTFYLTDSGESTDMHSGRIYQFDYDLETGTIGEKRLLVDVSDEKGIPDGLTVDSEGHLWSARWNSHCLVRYTPEGEEVERIDLPAKKVSSVIFGGSDYQELFVTTACPTSREEEGDGAGAVFRISLDRQGREEFRSSISPDQEV